MRLPNSYTMVFSSVAIGLLVASCGPNKVAQCNNLINATNKAATETQQLQPKSNQLEEVSKLATSLDGFATEIGAVKISDEKLKGFQGRFVNMYRDTSKAIQDSVDALKKRDIKAVEKAQNEFQRAIRQEAPLVNDLNKYCKGS